MRNKHLVLGVVLCSFIALLTGCGRDAYRDEMVQAQKNNTSIRITIPSDVNTVPRAAVTWGELDQLTSFKTLRRTWDDEMQIVRFDSNSKNGIMFIDLEGNWSGNNTMYNVFQNKAFNNKYSEGKIRSKLAKEAIAEFSDIPNESTGIYASINAYFNIIPTNADGTSGLTNALSRAEVMSAIYRADSPVVFEDTNTEFEQAVGTSHFNEYAANVADNSYLDYKNGSLCYATYNDAITRAEVLYMLVQRYWKDEYNSLTSLNGEFSDCVNGGNIAEKLGLAGGYAWQAYELEYALETESGCPESLYKAIIVARNHGLISSETKWNQTISGGMLMTYLVTAYQDICESRPNHYAVNANMGANVGESLVEVVVAEPEIVESELGGAVVTAVRDVTDLDELLRVYGDELDMTDEEIDEAKKIAEEWTFEAADQWMEVAYCTWLNVRTGPSTDYSISKSVPTGSKRHVIAVCKENGWYRIISEGKIVYQCGVYFKEFEGSDEYLINGGGEE